MKTITVKNLMIQFDTDDENADKHTGINILETINSILAERSGEVGSAVIFTTAIDDSDIEISGNDNEIISITAIDKNCGDTMGRSFSTTNNFLLKNMIEVWEKEIPYAKYELVTDDDFDDYPIDIQTVLEDLEVSN